MTITRGPDRLVKSTTTDSTGAYRVLFEEGTGDYLVGVAMQGFRTARRRVQNEGAQRELVANFTLAPDVTALAAVRVTAERPVRADNRVSPTQIDPGSAERYSDGVSGQISPTVAGDLNAIAGTMSNITMGAGGPSILGSGAASNLTTLNGMGMAGGNIPRAARTETRVTGATFDAARGGFAGANIDVRLGAGSRSYMRRNAFVTFDPPAFAYTDPTTRSLGTTSGGFRSSIGADGELVRRALTYNVALDAARSASDAKTQTEYWKIFWEQPEIADSIITPTQRQLMPMLVSMLAIPQDRRKNSRWQFGRPVRLVDPPPRPQAPSRP